MRTLSDIEAAAKEDIEQKKGASVFVVFSDEYADCASPHTILALCADLRACREALVNRQIFNREGGNIMKSMAGVTVTYESVLCGELEALKNLEKWRM